jgi:phospholipid/cholesterol/gamma-HCH transport system substrate-binding protein
MIGPRHIDLRNTDQWVGLLVVLAVIAFLGAVLRASLLSEWYHPVSTLRIVLPETGVGELVAGADVEVVGIRFGSVRRIVIDPSQQIYAEAEIDDQARAFIRRDSQAVIRRRFVMVGAAYVDISRGRGTPLDWKYAVIDGTTESTGALIDEARQKMLPLLEDAGRTMHALAVIAERLQRGEGDIGRLLSDETITRRVADLLASLQEAVGGLTRTIAQAEAAAGGARESLPVLLRRVDETLATLQAISKELARAASHLPQIARNVEGGTNNLPALMSNLPALMTQTQQTEQEVQQLIAQLRSNWLLGGGGSSPPPPRRLPSTEIRP